jgi:hypothetical protein
MFKSYFQHKSMLHTVLRFNAAFSGIFGLLFLALPGMFSEMLGISSPTIIIVTGVLLLIWEVTVFSMVKHVVISPASVWVVIAGDLIWVLGSIGLLLGGWLPMTSTGKWFVAIIADIVLVFAVFQFIGVRRHNRIA